MMQAPLPGDRRGTLRLVAQANKAIFRPATTLPRLDRHGFDGCRIPPRRYP
jgi:hypothetical protein